MLIIQFLLLTAYVCNHISFSMLKTHIHKRFGKEISVGYFPNEPARECSLMSEMRVIEGTTKDWKELAGFHYRSHRTCAPRKVFCLKRGEELCGVIVYCLSASQCLQSKNGSAPNDDARTERETNHY